MRFSLKKFLKKKEQVLKFLFSGFFLAIFDIVLLYIFVDLFHIQYILSAIITFTLASILSYVINTLWIFLSGRHQRNKEFLFFLFGNIVGLLINIFILWVGVQYFSLWYIPVKIFAVLIASIWNFWSRKKFIFLK